MRRPRYFGQLAGNWFLRDRNLIPEKNHMADAAASAAPKINKRYLIQDGSTVAVATRSRSLVWFGSCVTSIARSTAMRNCTRDEGGPFGFGNQVLIPSHRKLLRSKAVVVSVAETPGRDSGRHGRERRAQANRCRSVESGLGDVRTGG